MLLEFAFIASFFFVTLVGVIAGSHLYWTHNALVEATRRAARYAAMQPADATPGTPVTGVNQGPSLTAIRRVAIHGNPDGTGPRLIAVDPASDCTGGAPCLQVDYQNFGVGQGTVSVSVVNYQYTFKVPGVSQNIPMPAYRSTIAGESAGAIP